MALTYDNSYGNGYLKGVYTYDSSTATFSSNLKSSTSFDYFLDTAVAGDCFYVLANDAQAFKNLRIYVGTAFASASATFVWEYSTGNGTWASLSNVTNNNAFTLTGQQDITWDMPRNWGQTSRHTNSPIVNLPAAGGWIRCRLSAVTSITEGGAQSTQTIGVGRNLISVDSGTESFASIRAADVAGGWGITDATLSGISIQIYAQITIASGATLADTVKMVEIVNSLITNNGTMTLGAYNSTYDLAYSGCFLYLKSFGYGGGHNHFGGNGAYNFYGSSIVCLYPGTFNFGTAAGTLIDTIFQGFYSGCEMTNKTIKRCRYYSTGSWNVSNSSTANTIDTMFTSGQFFLAQQSLANVTAENVTADNISCYSVYTARNIYLINPLLISANPLRVSFFALGGGDHDVNYYTQFRFDLRVINGSGNSISGATVVITDALGTEVFSGTTDEDGEITQQVLTKQIDFFNDPNPAGGSVTVSTPDSTTSYTPHTITISKPGYQTKTLKLTMDRKREEVEVLEKVLDMNLSKHAYLANQ